jgi:lysozyme
MKPSENCHALIKQFEGCRLKAYKDSAAVWTIGYGTTYYPDGNAVRQSEVITQERAEFLLKWQVLEKSGGVDALVNGPLNKLKHGYSRVNQNQFDALVSFAYNVGTGALKKSTLLKKILVNANDPTIEQEFLKWDKVKKVIKDESDKSIITYVPVRGLTKRRQAEADLYFK